MICKGYIRFVSEGNGKTNGECSFDEMSEIITESLLENWTFFCFSDAFRDEP